MVARPILAACIGSLLASAAGCALGPSVAPEPLDVPAHGPDGAPVAMLEVHDRLGWPFSLDVIAIGVDGDAVAELTGEAVDDHHVAGAVALPKGEHRITATALARYSSTPFAEGDCVAQLRRTERIYVGEAPLSVRFAVHSRAKGRAFPERLGMAVKVEERNGGAPVPGLSARSVVERELIEGPEACLGETIPDDVDPLARGRLPLRW